MVHRARWIYPTLVSALVALYWLVPSTHPYVVGAMGLLSLLGIRYGIVTYRPTRANAWRLIALAIVISTVGEISYDLFATGGVTNDFPSVTDDLFLATYPPLAVGLLWLGLPRSPSRDRAAMIDTAALSLAASLIVWVALISPTVSSLHLTGVAKAVTVAGWVGDSVVLAAAIRLVTAWPKSIAAWMLATGIATLISADVLYGVALIRGNWHSGGPIDILLLLFLALCGAAAVLPSMREIGSVEGVRHRFGARQLTAVTLALLVAPTALLVEATHGPIHTPIAIAIVSAVGGLLAVWRLQIAVKAQRSIAVRDAIVRQSAQQIGLATTPEAVLATLSYTLGEIARGSPTSVRLEPKPSEDPAPPLGLTSLRLAIDTDAARGPDIDPADYPDSDLVFTMPSADVADLEDVLAGLAEQAAVALQRINLSEQVRASEIEQEILAFRASHDPLTGLANGDLFRRRLREIGNLAHTSVTAVVFIDLDDFKSINDTLGHEAGDSVLVATAERIRQCLRPTDLGARLGGDEFAALVPDIDHDDVAYGIAARIADRLALPTIVAGLPVRCRASVGVATAATAEDFSHLMRRADAALYAAKAEGKGRWRPYEPAMRSPLHRGSDLRAELQGVLDRADGQPPSTAGLTMHYQPIVDFESSKIHGFEALIRFRHPERGSIPVSELIAVAEQTGLIVPLGNWALNQAIMDAARLTVSNHGKRYVSVNVSATQLRQPDFADRVQGAVMAAGVDPTRLVIEMTETQPLDEDDEIWGVLATLSRAGLRIAIDDYGTGHASLGYLRQPIIDILKLDQVFLRDLADNRGRSLVSAVIDLTRELEIELVAEGIEDDETRTALIGLGCRIGQGHLFAPAMPIDDVVRWRPPSFPAEPAATVRD